MIELKPGTLLGFFIVWIPQALPICELKSAYCFSLRRLVLSHMLKISGTKKPPWLVAYVSLGVKLHRMSSDVGHT